MWFHLRVGNVRDSYVALRLAHIEYRRVSSQEEINQWSNLETLCLTLITPITLGLQ